MHKTFSNQRTHVWFDILPKFIDEYYDKYHRTIGMKPNEVGKHN